MARMKFQYTLVALLGGTVACVSQVLPASTTTVIGANGGTAVSDDGLFWLDIPAGALSADVSIVIETERDTTLPKQLGARYRVLPANLAFTTPATAHRRVRESWVGELSLGSPDRTALAGSTFDAESVVLSVQLRDLACEGRACSELSGCGADGTCVDGACTSECASDFECVAPADCLASGTPCSNNGERACTTHRCGSSGQVSVSFGPTRPTSPSVGCTGDTFVVYNFAIEQPCGGRSCGQSCASCDTRNPTCRQAGGTCDGSGACVADAPVCQDPPLEQVWDGWDDAPGSGSTFVLSQVFIANDGQGFDLDGNCASASCADNQLWQLGQLANDQIRQGLLGGETLIVLEVSGIDEPYTGTDDQVTVKVYGARDVDDPFFPANNFSIPAGDTKCCEFLVNAQSVAGSPAQARTRMPARIRGGHLSTTAPGTVDFTLTVGVPPHPSIRLERAILTGRLSNDLARLEGGLLGGAIPVHTLARTENPYCKTLNNLCQRAIPVSTLLDLIGSIFQPDIDLDVPNDGLESIRGGPSGRIEECVDGDRSVISSTTTHPWECALSPRMADGYSIGVGLTGTRAILVGVAE
jgi:hypothetical protein